MAFDLVEDISLLIEAALPTVTVKSELAADVANCIAVISSGGYPPMHTFGGSTNQKPAIIEPSFQVSCRNETLSALDTWWDAIKAALDGKTSYTPTGTTRTYLIIYQSGDVISLGRDDNRRHIQVLNFNTMVQNAY